jgi:hypothetical protein
MLTESPRPIRRPRAWRTAVYRLLACCLSVMVACAVGELALRAGGFDRSYANPFASFHERDPVLGWRGKPNFTARLTQRDYDVVVAHDESGFRRRGERPGTTSTRPDVFVLGDSFVWGWGVGQGQLCTDRLESLWPGHRVQNLGLCGAGTVQEFVIFEKHVRPRLRPGDTVVLAFYGNDFGDNLGRFQNNSLHATVQAGEVCRVPPSGKVRPSAIKDKLKDASYLFNLLTYCADRCQHRLGDWRDAWSPASSAARRKAQPGDTAPSEGTLADDSPEVRIVKSYLAAFQTACAENRAALVVAYIPFQVELGEAELNATVPRADPPAAERQAFFRCADALGIETIDLLPHFLRAKAAGDCARITFAHDLHWNAEGHALAAQVIAAHLAAKF